MKIEEILIDKSSKKHTTDMLGKVDQRYIDMIFKKVDDLKDSGMSNGDILIQIKKDHGTLGQKIAKMHSCLCEATHKLPQTKKEFEYLKSLFEKPLPAGIAISAIRKVIQDDSLEDVIGHIEESIDIRDLLAHWIKTNFPALIKRRDNTIDDEGLYSVLHGYAPK